MRRPRGHIQQRSEGSFRLRYTLGRDPATGKRRTATATVRGTRKDADLMSVCANSSPLNSNGSPVDFASA